MSNNLKKNFTRPDIWIRLLYMVVFAVLLMVARLVIWVVAVLQFLLVLILGRDNLNLRQLGQGTAKWCLQAFLFLTFNSEDKPFPFSDWPELDPVMEPVDAEEAVDVEIVEETIIAEGESAVDDEDVPSFTDESDEREK